MFTLSKTWVFCLSYIDIWKIKYLWSLKALAQYLCVVSFSRLLGKLTIDKAAKGHFWNWNKWEIISAHNNLLTKDYVLYCTQLCIYIFTWTCTKFPLHDQPAKSHTTFFKLIVSNLHCQSTIQIRHTAYILHLSHKKHHSAAVYRHKQKTQTKPSKNKAITKPTPCHPTSSVKWHSSSLSMNSNS